MSAGACLLGVDAGLTVTKAVVFDLDGRPLGIGSVPSRCRILRARWVEKDPDEQWDDFCAAVRAALAASGRDAREIAAVGVTAHGDGVVLLDERCRPVRPALPSLDTRAHRVVERWRGEGMFERALELAGEVPFPQHAPAMLKWLEEHEPETIERTRWVTYPKDWLKLRLTGRLVTDPTEASAGFAEVRSQRYARAVLEVYGLERLEGRLPPVVPCTEVVGEVLPEAGGAVGLVPGTPVASGLHDVDAAALGSGCTSPGELMMVAGTYSVNEVIGDFPALDARWLCRNWIEPGRWMHMSTSATSATNLEWFVRHLCPDEAARAERSGSSPFSFVDGEVAPVLDGDCRLFYHPFLFGSPHGDAASGAFLGLRGWHTRGHVLRALLEGVVFNHRTHVDPLRAALPVRRARLAGGGTRSELWSQMFADALALEVSIGDAVEAGALGAALCAGVAAGVYDDVHDAVARAVRVVRVHEPDDAGVERLAAGYDVYRATVDALAPVWDRIG